MHDTKSFHFFFFEGQIFYEIAQHLLESREKIFNSIKRQKVLLILFLIEISSEIVPHSFFHYTFFYFREIIFIKMKIFYQLSCNFAIIICRKSFYKLNLKLWIVSNKYFGSLNLVQIYKLHEQIS